MNLGIPGTGCLEAGIEMRAARNLPAWCRFCRHAEVKMGRVGLISHTRVDLRDLPWSESGTLSCHGCQSTMVIIGISMSY